MILEADSLHEARVFDWDGGWWIDSAGADIGPFESENAARAFLGAMHPNPESDGD